MRPTLATFLLVAALLQAESSVSPVSACIDRTCLPGLNGASFPLVGEGVVAGTLVSAVRTTDVGAGVRLEATIDSSEIPASSVMSGISYYLEVIDGALEGERLEVDVGGTIGQAADRVILDPSSDRSTTPNVDAALLAGARFVIRPHLTLRDLPRMFSPALTGNNNSSLADGVLIYGHSGFTTYYLRGDGVTWRRAGSTADFAGLVISPHESLLIQLRSGAKALTHSGAPRMNAFRVPLKSGYTVGATGYAADISPLQFGAVTNAGPEPAADWTGSNVSSAADSIQVYDTAKGSFVTYYLRGDGTTWRMAGSTTVQTGNPFLRPDSFFIVKRHNPNPAHLVLRPY